jgi:tRNA(fMet)-specific endonuclease VapC
LVKILDSDHCVALLRGRLELAELAVLGEELGVTSVSVGELTHGAHKSARVAENLLRLNVLLSAVTILGYDERAARRFGALKAELERAGTVVADLDLQIASIAVENDASLLTHNRKHFERIPALKLENWI